MKIATVALFAAIPGAWLVAIAYVAMVSYHGGVVLLPLHVGGVLALVLLRRKGLARGAGARARVHGARPRAGADAEPLHGRARRAGARKSGPTPSSFRG